MTVTSVRYVNTYDADDVGDVTTAVERGIDAFNARYPENVGSAKVKVNELGNYTVTVSGSLDN